MTEVPSLMRELTKHMLQILAVFSVAYLTAAGLQSLFNAQDVWSGLSLKVSLGVTVGVVVGRYYAQHRRKKQ